MHWLFEPGFWTNPSVRTALVVGTVVAIASSVVGTFVVLRAQSFAGHALTDVATAGGAGATLVGAPALAGFLGGAVVGASGIEAIGSGRVRGKDVATGIVLGAATGAAALFFYLASTRGVSSTSTQQVLFGSIFTVSSSMVPVSLMVSAGVVAAVVVMHRPLTLLTVSEQLAKVRGVPTRFVATMFMLSIAVVVALSSVVVGSVLSTALLVGPAATALRLTRTLRGGVVLASVVGVLATSLGVLISYDSYDWSGTGRAAPVSFCIVAVIVVTYAFSSLAARRIRPETGTR